MQDHGALGDVGGDLVDPLDRDIRASQDLAHPQDDRIGVRQLVETRPEELVLDGEGGAELDLVRAQARVALEQHDLGPLLLADVGDRAGHPHWVVAIELDPAIDGQPPLRPLRGNTRMSSRTVRGPAGSRALGHRLFPIALAVVGMDHRAHRCRQGDHPVSGQPEQVEHPGIGFRPVFIRIPHEGAHLRGVEREARAAPTLLELAEHPCPVGHVRDDAREPIAP